MSRPTLQISPSLVDSFEYWRDTEFEEPEAEERALADLVAQVKGERRPATLEMARGLAWHTAVEGQGKARANVVEVAPEGAAPVRFLRADVEAMREATAGGVREMWASLDLLEVGAVMRLRPDAVVGLTVHELKTTSRFDPDRYIASAQWRCYLLALDLEVARYHIVRLAERRGVWAVADYQTLDQFRYPAMRTDVLERAGALVEFIRSRGLESYRLASNMGRKTT